MKKFLTFLLFIPLFFACNNDDDDNNGTTPSKAIEGLYHYYQSPGVPELTSGPHTYISFASDYSYSIYKCYYGDTEPFTDISDIKSGIYHIKDSVMTLKDNGTDYEYKIVLTDSTLTVKQSESQFDYISTLTYEKVDATKTPFSSKFFISTWVDEDEPSINKRITFTPDEKSFTVLYGSDLIEGTYEVEKNKLAIIIDGKSRSFVIRLKDSKLTFEGDFSDKFAFLEGSYKRFNTWLNNANINSVWVSQTQKENIKHLIFSSTNNSAKTIIYSADATTPSLYYIIDSTNATYELLGPIIWSLNTISLKNGTSVQNYICDMKDSIFIMIPEKRDSLKSEYYIKASDESSAPLFNAIMGSWKKGVNIDSASMSVNASYTIDFEPTLKLVTSLSNNTYKSSRNTSLGSSETASYKFENNKLIIGKSSYSVEISNNELTINLVDGPEYFKYTGTFTKN